jgi:hypothetical protein
MRELVFFECQAIIPIKSQIQAALDAVDKGLRPIGVTVSNYSARVL